MIFKDRLDKDRADEAALKAALQRDKDYKDEATRLKLESQIVVLRAIADKGSYWPGED